MISHYMKPADMDTLTAEEEDDLKYASSTIMSGGLDTVRPNVVLSSNSDFYLNFRPHPPSFHSSVS